MNTYNNKYHTICNETDVECSFLYSHYRKGEVKICEYLDTHALIFCIRGHLKISSNLFSEEFLCAGEIFFIPKGSNYMGIVKSDATLLIHLFTNTLCKVENCILAFLYTHKQIIFEDRKRYYSSKLSFCEQLKHLIDGIGGYISDEKHEPVLWNLKHKEVMWLLTRYYSQEQLQLFFHPMTDKQIPFKSLVLAHYRKAQYTDKLAKMCGYSLHTFRRLFKEEFGISVHRWLIKKRAEHISYRLSKNYIPFIDIIDEFNFSSPQQFTRFCKNNLGDTPSNLRYKYLNDNTYENCAQK